MFRWLNRPAGFSSRRARLVLVLLVVLVYAVASVPLRVGLGTAIVPLSVVPVLATAWWFGRRGGLLAGVLAFPLSVLLMGLPGGSGWDVPLLSSALGFGALVLVGVTVGQLRDMRARLQREVASHRALVAQLHQREQFTGAVTDHVLDGLIIINTQGVVQAFNPAAERLFGYTAAEVLGQNVHLLMPEPFRSEHDGHLQRYRDTGESRIIGSVREVVGRRRDGTTFPLELAVSALPAGGQERFLGLLRDISQRKQSEESLRTQQIETATLAEIGRIINSTLDIEEVYERFASSVHQLIPYDHMVIGTVDLDQDTITNAYNTGRTLTPEWAIGKPHPLRGVATESVVRTRQAQLMQAETDAALVAQFPAARAGLEKGMHSTIAVPLLARDAAVGVLTLRSAQINAYTERHLDLAEQVGMQIGGAIANAWAYDELEVAQRDLRAQRQETAAIAELGRQVSSSLDVETVYARLADEVRKLVPFDRLVITIADQQRQQLTVAYAAGAPLPSGEVGTTRAFARTVAAAVVFSRRSRVLATEAEQPRTWAVGFRSTLVVPLEAQGTVVGLLHLCSYQPDTYSPRVIATAKWVARHIAGALANIWAYSALEAANTARRQAQATAQHLEAEARAAEASAAAARAAEEQKSALLSLVSHDLRSPLAAIQGLAAGLADELPAEARTDAAVIEQEADRLHQMVSNLLDLARLEAGMALRPQPQDLADLLTAVEREVHAALAKHPLTLLVSAALPPVLVDVGLAQAVLRNLLLNVSSHTLPGTAVTVTAEIDERTPPGVVVRIADQGPGIPPDAHDRVFQAFTRGDGQGRGSGLGLALTQQVVTAHGGQVWLEDTPDGGTTVALRLPAAGGQSAAVREVGAE